MWAEVTVAAQSKGRRIECADAWIAATALRHDVPLVTHNHDDYLGVPGLKLISHLGAAIKPFFNLVGSASSPAPLCDMICS
jgi:L-ascorbate metabolism protein UlaG (beta-lactamase superfamily)